MNRDPTLIDKPKPPIHMQRQVIIDADGTIYTVKRKHAGTKTLGEIYEDFLKRKTQNIR